MSRSSLATARLLLTAAIAVAAGVPAVATAQQHDHAKMADGLRKGCAEPTLACATSATPTFAPDGSLWLAWAAAGRILVARSPDLGRTFAPAVAVNPEPARLDTGPDARPAIVVDPAGRIVVAYPIFKDAAFNGQVLVTRSTDGGRTFSAPRPITPNQESQRFEAFALDADGSLFAAWLDKRNRAPAKAKGEAYIGAALAFAWSKDGGATFSEARLAQDNTCECCRLGVAFKGPGQPVVLFRNVYGGTVRDHAVTTFADPVTPGPVYRVAVDDWVINACPHHGPSLALSPDGAYHATWFTSGRARKGLFYAHSEDGGRTFSPPLAIGRRDRAPGRPYVVAVAGSVWVAWKEFDGERSSIAAMVSHDGGRSFGEPSVVANTAGTSDHPLLIASGARVFLSWLTQAEGYRLLPLEDVR